MIFGKCNYPVGCQSKPQPVKYRRTYDEQCEFNRQKAEAKVEQMKIADDALLAGARDYVADVAVATSETGRKFLVGYGIDLPIEHIVSIGVTANGHAPYCHAGYTGIHDRQWYNEGGDQWAQDYYSVAASPAIITIELSSGRKFNAEVCRHYQEIVLDAFMKAWRENR